MSSENTDHLDSLGLWCPSGGEFYVCDKAAVKFIGCCTSNPCSDGSGKCPSRDMREASFSADKYANIPEQSCDDARAEKVWYTCRDNDPPFLGCCASVPCGNGCPTDHLIQAVLSDDNVKALAFLPPSSTSSTDPSGTPTLTSSSTASAAPDNSSSTGLSTGAIAGIAVGGAAALIIVGILVWLCRRRVRKSNEGHQQSGPEMAYHDNSMPNSPAPFGHIRGKPRAALRPSSTCTDHLIDSHISSATTAIPHSYQSTPTSPDFHSKTYAHYSHPHYQHPSSPPQSALHPPSVYSQYTESDNGHQYQPVNPRHLSHMSAISGMSDPNTLHPVSEMDGGEQHQRVELPGNDATGPTFGRQH